MAIAWATDMHLDSVEHSDAVRFCAVVRESRVNALLISGDIADSSSVVRWLEFLDSHLEMPIYFVLGNHDYYGSSVQTMENVVSNLGSSRLSYLPHSGPVQISEGISLVGHGGWGDCRIGNRDSFEILTDYFAIEDLRETVDLEVLRAGHFERRKLRAKLGELGDRAAELLAPHLVEATLSSESVVVLTHVPPFRQSCWHDNAISEDTWLPGFTCKAIGDLLMSVAREHTNISYTVLCGHTHGHGSANILPNLSVITGYGDYGLLCHGLLQLDGKEVLVQGPTGSRL
jgi:predicted MPP superfamily phosphohydrolase